MVLVADDFKITVIVIEQRIGFVNTDLRIRVWIAAQLLQHLVDVIVVHVAVATRPHELPRLQSRLLSDHQRQQRIGCDIERYAEEHVAGTLI